ncbi:MAG: Crp/Fnr family transcriptional regulator [Candidatus Limivicinus sp.]|jgi:CRP-like cAMP-binding protein
MELTAEYREVLRNFFLFRTLPEADFEKVLEVLELREFEKNQPIYTHHSFQNSLAVILSGEAAVYKDSGTLLNLLGPGCCFGAAALFAPAKEYVTTVTASKASVLAFLPGESLRLLLRQYPDMAMEYISFLSGRIQFLNRKIDSFTTDSAEDALWVWLKNRAGGSSVVTVSGGYSRLARELSMGRASLYRALSQLENEGKIVKNGAEITILRR